MEELKKKIRSMVVSNPERPMTISQLDKYFKCHEGYHIPYEKYGFKHLDTMLRSMSDCVQLDGLGCSSLVLPVLTQKSNPIRETLIEHTNNGKKRKAEPSEFAAKKGKFEPSDCHRSTASNDVVFATANQNFHTSPGNNAADNSCFTMAELKKLIQAMVISNAGSPLTVAQLAKDFKQHEGTDIPYRDHGFQQLDALLRSIPDVVKIEGQASSALVYPVTSEKSKHIGVMIKAQKKKSKRCYQSAAYSSQSKRHSSNRTSNYNSQNWWAQSSNGRKDSLSNEYVSGQCSYGANNNHSTNPSYATHGCNGNTYIGHGNNVSGYSYVPNGYGTNVYNASKYRRYGINAPDQFNANRKPRDGCNISGHRSIGYAVNGINANNPKSEGNIPDNSCAPNGCNANRYPGKENNDPGQPVATNCCSANSTNNFESDNNVPFSASVLLNNGERRFLKLLYELLLEKRLENASNLEPSA